MPPADRSADPPADLYAVLEVDPDADDPEIRRAYQKLARRYHPHVAPDDETAEDRFAEVARAYEVLSDPVARRRYDALRAAGGGAGEWLESWSASEELIAGPGGTVLRTSRRWEVRARRSGVGEAAPVETREEDGPLPAVAGSGGPRPLEAVLDLAQAVRGTTLSIPMQRELVCAECGGRGTLEGAPCERCVGRGTLVELDRVRVRIPRGVADGARLRVAGRGAPLGPGRQGDLEILVRVRPHPYFRRRGNDVHAELPLTLAEAILGAEVEAPTLDGPVKVRIPPGTGGGRRLRLRGRGIAPSGGEPGDHYCTITIAVPQRVDGALRRLLEELPAADPRAGLPRGPL